MRFRSTLPLALLALAPVTLGVACFNSLPRTLTTGSTGTDGTGGARPDGGTGGATAPSGAGGAYIDASIPLYAMVPAPGQMVLDGDSLVLTSTDTTTTVGTLLRLPLGGTTTTVLTGGTVDVNVASVLTADANQFYYFAGDASGAYAVYALPRSGGTPTKIADTGTVVGAFTAAALAVDATRVYWVQFATDPTQAGGTVMAAPLGGGAAVELASVSNPDVPSGGIAVDGTSVYWTTTLFGASQTEGAAYSMPLAGGPPKVIYQGFRPGQITADGTSVYVLDVGVTAADCAPIMGTLIDIPLGGGPLSAVSSSLYGATNFLVANDEIYLAEGSDCAGSPPTGSLFKAPLVGDGGVFPTLLGNGAWVPISLVLDGQTLYASVDGNPGGIVRVGP